MPAGTNGLPDPALTRTFVAGAANPIDLEIGPGRDLFYVDLRGGTIRRIRFTSPNQPPSALIVANPTSGPVPLTVTFAGTFSSDPDGDMLTYAWDLDGDGAFDDSTAPTTSSTYTVAGNYQARLQVTDPAGASATSSVIITALAVNAAPNCSAVTATPGTLEPATRDQFKLITLSGATDPDGDALSIHIDAVSQDEPVSGSGVGDSTTPDARLTAAGANSNQLQVRRERNPMGNGRVYRIAYTVSDGHGASCAGIAKVAVPRKKGQTAVDNGNTNSWNSFTGAKL